MNNYDKISATLDYIANQLQDLSYNELTKRWGWHSKSTVYNFIKKLENGELNELRTLNELIHKYISISKERKKNDKKNENKEQKKEIIYPFNSQKFRWAWQKWLDYKNREYKQKYKTIDSQNIALNKLYKDCGGIEDKAIDMIELSISRRWQGIYSDNNLNEKYRKAESEYNNKKPQNTWNLE